jgi:DNA-binding NtrC family response regulator
MRYQRHIAILIIDDDAAIRRFVARTLREIGCAVVEVANATEGLTAFRIHPGRFTLAIIEATRSSASGLTLAAELGRPHPGLTILYTSRDIGSVALRSIAQAQPAAVIAKPFTRSALLSKVRELVPGAAIGPAA